MTDVKHNSTIVFFDSTYLVICLDFCQGFFIERTCISVKRANVKGLFNSDKITTG